MYTVHEDNTFYHVEMSSSGFISEILGTNENYHITLSNWIAQVIPTNVSWVRCYKESIESSVTMAEVCGGKGAILVLVQAQGYIFGGFLNTSLDGKCTFFPSS